MEIVSMKTLMIAATLLGSALIGCGQSQSTSSLTASGESGETQTVSIVGYRISHQTVTFQVAALDCVNDLDYEVTWLESLPSQVLLTRRGKINCSGKQVIREIKFPATDEYFTVANPVTLEKPSYDCNSQKPSASSAFWEDKRSALDIPQKEENLLLAIKDQGCADGTSLALTKWIETLNGMTGRKSRDIQTKNLCVRNFANQASILAGQGGVTWIRVLAIENGVIKKTEVTTNIHEKHANESHVLHCKAH